MPRLGKVLSYVLPVFRTIVRLALSIFFLFAMAMLCIPVLFLIFLIYETYVAVNFKTDVCEEAIDVLKWAIFPICNHIEQERILGND